MEKRILKFVDALLSLGRTTSLFAFLAFVASIFGVLWTLCEASGNQGSTGTLILLVALSLLLGSSLFLVGFFRWNLIVWALRRNLDELLRLAPDILIGLGRGGGIIAALLCKLITERTGKEPLYCVMDRTYFQDGRTVQVEIGDLTLLNAERFGENPKVLVVSAETHSGNTLKILSDYLNAQGILHKTFSFIASPSSYVAVDYCVLRTDSRSLLPWSLPPIREGHV